jgi:2-polyprenyl-3-methyl-5-hydroxy-6-metoxy-1,4-benzoquinol methylase
MSSKTAASGIDSVAEQPCEVCGDATFRGVYALKGDRENCYRQCASCHLVRAPVQSLFDYQGEEYLAALVQQALAASRIWEQTLDHIERLVPVGRLVEVGCGIGTQLAHARKRGWQVRGFEKNRQCPEEARLRYDIDVRCEDFLDHGLEQPVDVILMHQLIEHVLDPNPFLEASWRALRRGGLLVMTTPNWSFAAPIVWSNRVLRTPVPKLDHLQPRQHVRLFSPRTMRALAFRLGWTIEMIIGNPTDALGRRRLLSPRRLVGLATRTLATLTRQHVQLSPNILVALRKPLEPER